jgi:NADPH:quinone reductase-like Zn-dependent oxidoreductase
LENLTRVDRPRPEPGRGEVLVRMRAVSPNYRDILMIQGAYNPNQPLPLIPFSDGVGVIEEIGAGVERVETGDRVCPIFAQKWHAGRPTKTKLKSTLGGPLDGTLTDYMAVPAESVVEVPDSLSDAQAATLPCAGLTAWNALVEQGDVKPGQTVVTLGTGGVSSFALQIANALGARTIITSSSDEKLDRMRSLGADDCINYERTESWGEAIKQMTGGVGADHVVELGGANTLSKSVGAVRPGGHVSLIGVLSGTIDDFDVIPVLMQNIRIQGVIVGHREMFERFCDALASADWQPLVDETFDIDNLHDALKYVIAGKHMGKISIELST